MTLSSQVSRVLETMTGSIRSTLGSPRKHAIGRAFGDEFQRTDDMNDKALVVFWQIGITKDR